MISSTITIPAWTSAGVLPPIPPSEPGHSMNRSPYVVDLTRVFDRFATSQERRKILDGLLQFRAALHAAGITSGFQWLDGSFLEQVETLEGRAPRDMDLVTFFNMPEGLNQQQLYERHEKLFNQEQVKTTYAMDAYFMPLGQPTDSWQIKSIAYWYSMWSHRRDGLWKGFVQVDLDPAQDSNVCAMLNHEGGSHHD